MLNWLFQSMNWLYNKLLWFWGFKMEGDPEVPNEKITFMLRRQKERLGIWWWFWAGGWLSFWIWLFLHILEIGGL